MNKSESKYFNTAAKMNRALISLLKNKSFEYISVSEICKAAGVNRSTFLDRFNYPITNRQYIMMYYLNGINAIVIEWLKNDCNKSIEEISEIIRICIYGLKSADM